MKGFIIFEDFKHFITCKEILDGDYNCVISVYPNGTFSGIINRVTGASCTPKDTYDFETGALIALMRMCGREKVTKACDELYKDDNYKNALQEMTENNEKLIEENNYLKYVISCRESAIESLENTRDLLINKNNELISDKDKSWKNYQRNIQKKQDRINELNNIEEKYIKLREEYDNLFVENEKLKLDCEKLQHGYIDTDMIFCGGRQNGKQYTFLVDLFKKLDQKKVDAAYKEAYNTKLPVWQREFLKEALSIYKPPTKREQMWNDILACDCEYSKYVKVKKEDLETFAKECNEKKIFNIIGYEFHAQEWWFADDRCIFQIFRKPAGFICAKSVGFAYENAIIDYLPPMRWDLFEKGRKIVRVTPENIDEFIVKCTNKFGSIMKPVLKRYKDFTHAFIMISDYHYDNKPTIHIMTPEDLVRNQHENPKKYSDKKIVNWEDVR